MPASKAQAMISGLTMLEADPASDSSTVHRLALWALRQFSPIVAADGDGLIMDTEGADHLLGGERPMLTWIVNSLRGKGLTARAAVADTWGAAHALARYHREDIMVCQQGGSAEALVNLPLEALRLPVDTLGGLRVLGFRSIGDLAATPRAPLTLRFGPEPMRRIDQVFGRASEPIEPLRTPDMMEVAKSFAEPIGAPETIAKYVRKLSDGITAKLSAAGLGVRRVDLFFHRVDNTFQSLRAGLAKPVRDPARLSRLLCDCLDRIDPGFGIERMVLTAVFAEPLEEVQVASVLVEETAVDVTPLVDLFENRGQRVFRVSPVASDVPERSVQRVGPGSSEAGESWPSKWPRPARLFLHPEHIDVIALLPDQPPAVITWRGKRMRVVRADGPERIFGEWWKRPAELDAVRDYFAIEVQSGERYWIYRSGDGLDASTGSHRWFIHGVFG